MANGKFDLSIFLEQLGPAMTSFTTLFKIFSEGYAKYFWSTLKYFP